MKEINSNGMISRKIADYVKNKGVKSAVTLSGIVLLTKIKKPNALKNKSYTR